MTQDELRAGQERRLESARSALAGGLWAFVSAGEG